MELIVHDVDKYKINSCKRKVEENYSSWYDDLIAGATEIPENATNGDIMKLMFPSNVVKEIAGDCIMVIDSCEDRHYYSKKWWNARYGGSEDEGID